MSVKLWENKTESTGWNDHPTDEVFLKTRRITFVWWISRLALTYTGTSLKTKKICISHVIIFRFFELDFLTTNKKVYYTQFSIPSQKSFFEEKIRLSNYKKRAYLKKTWSKNSSSTCARSAAINHLKDCVKNTIHNKRYGSNIKVIRINENTSSLLKHVCN